MPALGFTFLSALWAAWCWQSRREEYIADRLAVTILIRAGYDAPRLASRELSHPWLSTARNRVYATHPTSRERRLALGLL